MRNTKTRYLFIIIRWLNMFKSIYILEALHLYEIELIYTELNEIG